MKILLVGCGKMGGALLRAWGGDPGYELSVIDPKPAPSECRFVWEPTLDRLQPEYVPDIVVIAVKPQQMAELLSPYAKWKQPLFLSIAAGVRLEKLALLLGGSQRPLLRAMPNLPASVGRGVTALVASESVTPVQREAAQKLLEAVGLVEWVADEGTIDAVTALSGSGPAYFCAMIEAMAVAGENLGLSSDMARRLALQTFLGTGALLEQTKVSPSELRIAVTSPKGTTAAALELLFAEEGGLFALMSAAMESARDRARELAR